MNNNRNNTFIPNPQDIWGDIYSLNNLNPPNSNGGQVPPFTAHQQVQQLQQGQYPMYSVGYTTTAPNTLQASFNPMFSQAWEGLEGNNGSGMQMNYSYQQVNSLNNCYPNQHQQILQPHNMMQQIVSQSPRVVPLPLDAPHFVPAFSMNLSPTGPMVPFSLSSSPSIHSHSTPVSINSGSFNPSSMVHFNSNPSPPKMMHVPLNSRSSGTPAPVAHSQNSRSTTPVGPLSFSNSQSSSPLVPMSLNSRSFSNMVQPPLNSQSSGSMAPLQLSFNSRSSIPSSSPQINYNSSFAASSSAPINFNSRSSTPITMSHFSPNCGSPKIPISLNAHSPASITSFSTSSSPSPPPPPPKKPPRQRKKKEPMRPLPVNPSTLPLPIDRGPTLPLYLNRSSGIVTSNVNSWPHPVLSPSTGQVIGSRLPIHLTSPTNVPTSINRLFPMAPLPAHQSSHTIPVSPHRSPPMVPVTAHQTSPLSTLSINRSSHHPLPTVSNTTHLSFPSAPIPISRASPIQHSPASFNHSPPRMPLPINTASPPTPIMLHQVRNASPPKVTLPMSRVSVLQYAPERAATPSSNSCNSQDEMESVDVFQEEEILKLVGVGEMPDQTAELQRINPIHELNKLNLESVKVKAEVSDTASICSWEQDAFKGAANSPPGDEDLETELKRFYCPPSPPKDSKSSDAKRPSTGVEVTSSSTSATTTASNVQSSIGGTRRKSTQQPGKSEPPKKPGSPTKSGKSGRAFIELSSDDDDDLEVLLVKVGDKRRRAPAGGGARGGRGGPPKKVQRGRGQAPRGREIKASSPGNRRYTVVVDQTGAGPSKQMDPRLKAIARPAYPNGRYVAVAPRSTVPIPPRNQPSSNIMPNKPEPSRATHPRMKGTARKSTAPIPHGAMTARKSTTPLPNLPLLGKKGTARKSTTPMPKTRASRGLLAAEPQASTSTRPQRYPRSSSVNTRAASKTSGAAAKEDAPRIVITRLSPEDINTYVNRPPIKLTLSLSGAGKNQSKPRPRSKKHPSPTEASNKGKSQRASTSRPKEDNQQGRNERKRSSSGLGSDDDLFIVQEYLADSDESFDWEGERDEASSDSDTEPEPDSDEEGNNTATTTTNVPIQSPGNNVVIADDKKPSDNKAIEGETKVAEDAIKNISQEAITNNPSDSESESEEVVGENEVTLIKAFEAPKPTVILKGTKEDADAAVTNLRNALAQLSKNKAFTSLFSKR